MALDIARECGEATRHNNGWRTLIAAPMVSVARSGGTCRSVDDLASLTKARSLLMLLLATCKETQLALEAAANLLDTD